MLSLRKTICLIPFFYYVIARECKGDDIKGYGPVGQCYEMDCPKYSVIHSEKEFEIRNYSQALWMTSPSLKDYSIMGGIRKGGFDLTMYYYHQNDEGINIINTGPVLMLDILNSSYTVNFYVPYKYQNGGLPKPLTSTVKPVKLPKYKYAAVRRSSASISDDGVRKEAETLRKNLQDTTYQRAVDRDQYTFVLYNAHTFTLGYEVLIWFD